MYKTSYVIYWKINQDIITAEFCENKAKPMLQCNGKCHLAKQLQEAENRAEENKTIPDSILKLKLLEAFLLNSNQFGLNEFSFKEIKTLSIPYHSSYFSEGYLNELLRPPQFI